MQSYKKMPVFSSAVTMQMQHLFSARRTVFYGGVNSRVTGHGLRGKERGRLRTDITEVQQRQEGARLCQPHNLPLSVSESSDFQDFLQSQRWEEGRENTKDTLGHKSALPLPGCPTG